MQPAAADFLSFLSTVNDGAATATPVTTDRLTGPPGDPVTSPVLPLQIPAPPPAVSMPLPGLPPVMPGITRSQSASLGGILPTALLSAAPVLQRQKSMEKLKEEWRTFLTIEDRQSVRDKIRAAYIANCKTFEDLLGIVVAVDEELLHISAPSRLDYFKSSFEFDSRLKLKRRQLDSRASATATSGNTGGGSDGSNGTPVPEPSPEVTESSTKKQRT